MKKFKVPTSATKRIIIVTAFLFIALFIFSSCGRAKQMVNSAPMMEKVVQNQEGAMAPSGMNRADKSLALADRAQTDNIESEGKSGDGSKTPDIRQNRKIIRTAQLDIYVEDMDKALKEIEALTGKDSGVIANKSVNRGGSSIYGTLTIWVPAERLMEYVESLEKIGKVTSSNVNAQDISDQYFDMDARLGSMKVQEKRLLELLDRPRTELNQILRLEQELARIRSEIEALEGRKRMWDQQISYSTVTISISQDVQVVQEPEDIFKPLRRGIRKIKPTFLDSTEGLFKFFIGLILLVTALLPWVAVAIILIWIFKKIFGKKLKERADRKRLEAEKSRKNNENEKQQGEQIGN